MKKTLRLSLLSCAVTLSLVGCTEANKANQMVNDVQKETQDILWAPVDSAIPKDEAVEQRVEQILAGLTLEQKVAQTIQPEIKSITPEDMRQYGFGSYLNGGGSFPNGDKHAKVEDWIALADAMFQASIDDSLDGTTIPTMWGTDAVHGHNNVIGATIFPHNIGLGATNNPKLINEIGAITAKEVRATGIDWVFAPTVATVRDDRWGRTYEGYSEDPEIVKLYAAEVVKGLQGDASDKSTLFAQDRVISTVKHFVGDGGTVDGDDQGNNIASEEALYRIHAQGYVSGLAAGSQSVMASFNSWQGNKAHGSHYLLTEVLKNKMGFDGFVVGDWNGHGQVAGCSNESCPQAMNAGLDMFMVPGPEWKALYHNTIAQVKEGVISTERLDDAVRRILRVKVRAGLFEAKSPAARALSGKTELIGHESHRLVAKQAVRESLVLLKNNQNVLPLAPTQRILLAGDGADNIGKQSGGWSITWQGTGNTNEDFPGGSSIYDGFKQQIESAGGEVVLSPEGNFDEKPDVAIVVFGEEPYAEGNGDIANVEYQRGNKRDLALLKRLKSQGIPVVSVFITGRPMWVNPELNASDAFVAAWLPGSEGAAVADVLLKDSSGNIQHDFKGKLTFSWPASPEQTAVNRHDGQTPLLPYGYGLTYRSLDNAAKLDGLPESFEVINSKPSRQEILVRDVKAPNYAEVVTQSKTLRISSSTTKTEVLTVSTMDKVVQEDARRLQFSGQGRGSYAVRGAFPVDFRSLEEVDAKLYFSLQVNDAVAGSTLALQALCDQQCDSQLDIVLDGEQYPVGAWQVVSVPVACFKTQGNDLANATQLFTLSANSKVDVSIADIFVDSGSIASLALSCTE
ncbi:Periplasmic beta-glucosidase [Pseudoalteromonas luteoviolacea B = ATCC 29581]|nr:Periplasmic beta-glucosidase [Pseudoalteromonas luteoviolacea B = ATCC 29581]